LNTYDRSVTITSRLQIDLFRFPHFYFTVCLHQVVSQHGNMMLTFTSLTSVHHNVYDYRLLIMLYCMMNIRPYVSVKMFRMLSFCLVVVRTCNNMENPRH